MKTSKEKELETRAALGPRLKPSPLRGTKATSERGQVALQPHRNRPGLDDDAR